MTMAVVNGYYSQLLSSEEYMYRASQPIRELAEKNNQKKLATANTQEVNTNSEHKTTYTTETEDEYTPSSLSTTGSLDKQSSSVYEKPNYSQSSSSASTDNNFPSMNSDAHKSSYFNYLWSYRFFHVDLSACDLASSEYTVKRIEINGGKTAIDYREVNGEPKIYSLDKIYEATNPDTGILYKKVSSPVNEPVPEEVKELGDWYVKHWNEISVSYVSNESKIVSSDDEDLTREEQMKIYALKSAVLFQQLHANEEAGLKKENYYIRDPLANTNGYKVATNPYINSLMWKL